MHILTGSPPPSILQIILILIKKIKNQKNPEGAHYSDGAVYQHQVPVADARLISPSSGLTDIGSHVVTSYSLCLMFHSNLSETGGVHFLMNPLGKLLDYSWHEDRRFSRFHKKIS
jgi:hypothetical protein